MGLGLSKGMITVRVHLQKESIVIWNIHLSLLHHSTDHRMNRVWMQWFFQILYFLDLIGIVKIDYESSSGLCSTSMVFSTLISTNWAHSEVSMTMCRKSKLSIECTAGSVSIIM